MCISEKLTKFIQKNKDKPKDEMVKLIMKEFNFKESTATVRYYDYRDKRIMLRKVAFDFFDKNPDVLEEIDNKTYSNLLGIPMSTYATYKSQYKSEKEYERKKLLKPKIKSAKKEPPRYGEQYFKGRLREKFTFDDSKL